MRRLIVALVVASSWISAAAARQWTDNTGSRHMEAELRSVRDNKVYLQFPDGKTRFCKWERFSAADQLWIRQRQSQAPLAATEDLANQPADENASPELSGFAQRRPGKQASLDVPVVPTPTLARFVLRQPDNAENEEKADARSGPQFRKFVYSGCRGTFHIYANPAGHAPWGRGTAHYWFWGHHYLALLTQTGPPSATFYYYKPFGGDAHITHWAFARYPDWCDCYWVWYYTKASGWRRFECDHRETLH